MPSEPAETAAILIPSYQPEGKLPPYVRALREAGFRTIVVVDDGSGDAYTPLFDAVAAEGGGAAHVIRYPANRGKGFALRTGMEHIRDACPGCDFVITADSDGQHTVPDVLRMAQALAENGEGLLLGSRDFSLEHVPAKSRMGNRITATVFRALYGQYVSDTQTGLRGFARALLPRFLQTRGDRYEYEMNQLIDCSIDGIEIRALPIETVYENNNEGSHFHPVRDSFRIYRVIFSRFFRFIAASAASFCLDYGLYLLLNNLFKEYAPQLRGYLNFLPVRVIGHIALATVLARIVSSVFNYTVNKKLVFANRAKVWNSFWRYACTVVVIAALSMWLTSNLHLWFGWNDDLIKMPVDIALFFLSYYVQRRWVFGGGAARGKREAAEKAKSE